MNAITIRNLPADVARVIRQKAKLEGTSLNRTVINLLRERVSAPKNPAKRTRYRDLSALAGSWTRAEAAEFNKHLSSQRKIGSCPKSVITFQPVAAAGRNSGRWPR